MKSRRDMALGPKGTTNSRSTSTYKPGIKGSVRVERTETQFNGVILRQAKWPGGEQPETVWVPELRTSFLEKDY